MPKRFEEIDHTADVALRVWGRDLTELFANAAHGLVWLIADPETIEPDKTVTIELNAYDTETLLVSWLGELLYLNERDDIVYAVFDLKKVTSTHLVGTAQGGPAVETRHHIKAVTFHEMDVQQTESGLETVVVFDV
jgi:SHS2 domain-containing protein